MRRASSWPAITSIGNPSAASAWARNVAAFFATRNVFVATARDGGRMQPDEPLAKRVRHASAARRAADVRRPLSSMPAPKRIVSRHVSRRKIWSPSTRPTSSRKLFEPRSTTASVAGRGGNLAGRLCGRRHDQCMASVGPQKTRKAVAKPGVQMRRRPDLGASLLPLSLASQRGCVPDFRLHAPCPSITCRRS